MSIDGIGAHAWSSSVSPSGPVSPEVLLNPWPASDPSAGQAVGASAPEPAPSSCSGTSARTVTR
ncbi:Uncharacterised protein [Mycobacteroides abscessus]|nr:Uncharacterised protein [Mycobacteroides abscessus]